MMLRFDAAFLHQNGCRISFPFFLHTFSIRIRAGLVDNRGRNSVRRLTIHGRLPTITRHGFRMPKYKASPDQNVLEFPGWETRASVRGHTSTLRNGESAVPGIATREPGLGLELVISGSYRKQFEALKETYEQFRDLGCTVLSPSSVSIVSEDDGFVYMRGEETETPERIEEKHLDAIQRATFVWLHSPEGYVGPTAALEIGYANAAGVPVYARELPEDKRFQSFVHLVDSPEAIVKARPEHPAPPAPALRAFQEYYRRAAIQRGYARERPKDCLLLMVEEIGELARALRRREKLVRHGSYPESSEAHELADVFLYVVHLANVLGLDLAEVVQKKESINIEKFLAK